MNAARRRIRQWRERLDKQRRMPQPKPQPEFVSPLAAQLHASIEQIKARHFEHLEVSVWLKSKGLIFCRISAAHPTADIMSMEKNGFWGIEQGMGVATPTFVPPHQIERVHVLYAE